MPQVYEPKFKRKLVRLHLEEGRSYKSLTQEYGVSKSAISKWVELFSNECQKKVNADPTALNDADLMKENLCLRKELEEARKENLFLKKAAAFFAKPPFHKARENMSALRRIFFFCRRPAD